ncbi:MAG: phosphoribosylanthranilate isomerase [Nitrospirae bacterium]|nr:MAG: phosphoribosylanthranilate isomerase [Nitrospirota bacterium]
MVKVKICGITNQEDAKAAVDAGADALGFVFVKESPRYIPPRDAADIIRILPPFVTTVGVFVNEPVSTVEDIVSATGIDLLQLHGEETPGTCRAFKRNVLKAIRVKSLESLDAVMDYKDLVAAFLLDTYSKELHGGTGQVFNWDIALEAKQFGRIILSGGLTPDNVIEAVRYVKPYAVDVSSGVELSKGRKEHAKVRLFIERARSVQW